MKKALIFATIAVLQGCATTPLNTGSTEPAQVLSCVGSTDIPGALSDKFIAVEDTTLLAEAIGEPLAGRLCQGAVYQSTQEVTIYRAWNSTNPNSQHGQWWAFDRPAGRIADYRKNYEICYQWSPLDTLEVCRLKVGTKIVVGNGQSAQCSDYLTYPVSETQQVYVSHAAAAVVDCQSYNGVMAWE